MSSVIRSGSIACSSRLAFSFSDTTVALDCSPFGRLLRWYPYARAPRPASRTVPRSRTADRDVEAHYLTLNLAGDLRGHFVEQSEGEGRWFAGSPFGADVDSGERGADGDVDRNLPLRARLSEETRPLHPSFARAWIIAGRRTVFGRRALCVLVDLPALHAAVVSISRRPYPAFRPG